MITSLFRAADWQAKALLIGALAVGALTLWIWRYQVGLKDGHKDRDVAVAIVQTAWDADRLQRSAKTLEMVTAAVAERNTQQEKANAAIAQYIELQNRHATVVAAHARDAERLRGAIQAYATGPADSADARADLTACRDRAGSLGGLLEEALFTSAACAANGESDRAAARALFAAWPERVRP